MSDTSNQDFSGGTSGLSINPFSAAGSLLGAASSFVSGQATTAADQAEATGYGLESQAYTEAAGYATGNVQLAEESTAIQQYQQQRKLATTLGRQRAEIAGANLGPGGSGAYLLRSSMARGALASGLIGVQGAINAQGYASQSTADIALAEQATNTGEAATSAASSSQTGTALSTASGIAGAVGGIAGVLSKIPIIGALF